MSDKKIKFTPEWDGDDARCSSKLMNLALGLVGAKEDPEIGLGPTIKDIEEEFLQDIRANMHPSESHRLEAAGSILIDLAKQGWKIDVADDLVVVDYDRGDQLSAPDEKNRIRKQELIKRDEQLSVPSVRRFIQQMESSKLYGSEFVSIFSLMRDGQDLATLLREHLNRGTLAEEFHGIIQPYLQVIDSDEGRCEFTGLALADIWRYFRHTWANQSNPVPGRSLRFLVRDQAAPYHPIIAIGAIGSPIVALGARDKEIGWDEGGFLKTCSSMPPSELLAWIHVSLGRLLEGLYLMDLFEEGVVDNDDLINPDDQVLNRLQVVGENARKRHREHAASRDYKYPLLADADCVRRARQDLFKWKRCDRLAKLLKIRRFLKAVEDLPADEAIAQLLDKRDGRWVLSSLIRFRKAEVIGINVADITVCGALPPYSSILAGKLVSALAVSSQMIEAYDKKYSSQISEIASGMAGRAIIRKPQLVLFGTTSLYGVASSQYNRIKIPCEDLGGAPGGQIQFKRVGQTDSFGSSQFSERTVEALVKLRAKSREGTRVHSIFGEGVSPKLRKIRDGLQTLGVPQNQLLRHVRHRAIYMIPVSENYSRYLMGFQEDADYLVPLGDSEGKTQRIVEWWMNRWAIQRCTQDRVLADIESHDFTHPIQHGARVKTPKPVSYQGGLFDL